MWRRTFLKFPAEEGTRTPTAFRPPAPKAGASANSATSASPTEYNIGTKSLVPSSRFPCVLEQFQLPLPSFPSFASLRRQRAGRDALGDASWHTARNAERRSETTLRFARPAVLLSRRTIQLLPLQAGNRVFRKMPPAHSATSLAGLPALSSSSLTSALTSASMPPNPSSFSEPSPSSARFSAMSSDSVFWPVV